MKYQRVVLSANKGVGSILIRLVTWSKFSHAALIDGDQVVEATAHGVGTRPLIDLIATSSRYEILAVPCDSPAFVIANARTQIGKPYDWLAILGLWLHRNWQDERRWFCSELVAWAFDKAGTPMFRPGAMHRITPQHLWILPL